MAQYAFYFDPGACVGCKTCELACKDYKDLGTEVSFRRVYDYERGAWSACANGAWRHDDTVMYHMSVSCNHCDNPACVHVCPTGAMQKDAETGLTHVDEGRCIGCGYCVMACPYNAPAVDRAAGHSVKCNGCAERMEAGKKPICVEACTMRALDFATAEALGARGKRADIAPLPPVSETMPNLFIGEGVRADSADNPEGRVPNVAEVS